MDSKKNCKKSFEEIDEDALANVGGGAAGLYGTVGWQVLGQGGSYTAAFPSWNPSTWSLYQSSATGASNGASVSAGFGAFYSNGDASNYFAGPGSAFSVGLNEGGKASIDAGWNDSGFSGGASFGLGASFPGIGVSSQSTQTEQLSAPSGADAETGTQMLNDVSPFLAGA